MCFLFFNIEVFQEGLWKDTSFEDPDLQSLSSRLQAPGDRFVSKGSWDGQVELPRLPIVEWAIASFRGMGDGRVFQPRTAMLNIILHLGFQYLNP